MKNRFSFFLLLIVWVTTSLTALGQVSVKELDAYIAKAVKDYETPGLAIAIIKDGQIVLNKGYGLRDLGKKDSVTANSIFGIASCSKAFTATAVGMLVDDGKLSWDDHVIDILPDFQLHDPYVTRELRVIDLLCHRAGFNTFDGDLLWYGTSYDRDEVVKRIRHLPLKNSLRYKYGYSNVMFITAGEVIEAVSGKSWDAFLKERIFTPLGMENTNTSVKDFTSTTERAMPHVKGIVFPDINYDNSGPAASLNSSVNDLTKWMQFWLNGGKAGDQQLLSESSFRKITSSQTVENVSGFDQQQGIHFKTYGLGWGLFDYNGLKVIEHDGGLPGYISKVAMIPEANLGVVILTNGMPILLNEALRNYIFDSFTQGKPRIDWTGALLKYAQDYLKSLDEKEEKRLEAQIPKTKPSLKEKEYAGIYEDKMYGKAEVKFESGKLYLTLLPTKELFTGRLEHFHYNTFKVEFKDSYLPFGLVTFELNS
ncbi:MAG: serine hydrolase, partial [Bacteroidetes bacterium]|nr:serine hydrolase [Bacteroidota bacterium]